MNAEFEMKDLGSTSKIIGIKINRNRHKKSFFVSQSVYVRNILEKFGMTFAKLVTIPLGKNFKLSANDSPKIDEGVSYM